MIKKIQFISPWLLYAYVFLLPWQTRWIIERGKIRGDAWEYGSYSLYAIEIILFLVILLQVIAKIADKRRDRRGISGLDLAIAGLALIAGLSFFWSLNSGLALYGWGRIMEGVALVWLISRMKFSYRWLVRSFVAGATVQAIIGLGQFLSQTSWGTKWLGMAVHDAGQLGTFVIEAGGERLLRAYGGLPHPNMLGGLLVVALILLFGLYFDLYRRIYLWYATLSLKQQQKLWSTSKSNMLGFAAEIVFYLFCFIISGFGLIATFSRGAWLGLIIALFIMGGLIILKQDKKKLYVFLKLGIILALIAGISLSVYWEPITTRFKSEPRLEQISLESRGTYQDQAMELLKENWIVGVGVGNYTQAVREKITSRLDAWEYQPVHNIFLLIGVELSVFGLLIFCFLVFEIFRRFVKSFLGKKFLDRWSLTGFGIILALLVIGIFDHYIWTLYFGIMLWWFGLGFYRKATK